MGRFSNRHLLFLPGDRAAPANDDDPTLTDDMLEMYFSSTRSMPAPPAADIWRSTRSKVTDPWGTPEPAMRLNDMNPRIDDQNPVIAGDGLTLWFSSNRGGSGLDIYFTTRGTRDETWDVPRLVAELSHPPPFDDLGPELARSLLRIALYGDGPPRRLFEATRPSADAPWSRPEPIDSLNTPSTANLSGLFVSPGGFGSFDIYRAVRPAIDEPFAPPELVEGINGASRDDDPWLSRDRHTVVFTSEDTGNQEIYVADRP
jgi:hypothetical protein